MTSALEFAVDHARQDRLLTAWHGGGRGGRECKLDACAAVMCLIFHKHSQGALLPGRYNNLHQLQAGYLGACSFMGHLTDHANACSWLWPMHKRFHIFRGGNRGEKHGADLASALGDIDAGRKVRWTKEARRFTHSMTQRLRT